jgi:predicted metalloprotease
VVVAAVVAALVAGCGGDGEGRSLPDVVRDAVEQARERVREASGEIASRRGQQETPIRNDTRTAFDYGEYERLVGQVIGSLEAYWARAMPADLDAAYPGNPSGYFYYRPEEKPGPSCGRQPAPPKNAFYCPPEDFIAWDETGLLIPYYIRGDFAAAYVLAHEFGHAIQARLPENRQLNVGILRELQADCLAGAWARSVEQQGLLQAGDLDEAVTGLYSARDLPGTDFTDPRAHGSGFQRIRAFGHGYEGGPRECLRPDWVVRSS